jgi:ATP-dependent DNA helicase RecQ
VTIPATRHLNTWLEKAIADTTAAYLCASAPGDRLALLRELARLNGGRAMPPPHAPPDDLAPLFRRFGLARSSDGAVRLLDEDLEDIAPGLTEAMRIDAEPRGGIDPAPPDAALLRLTPHSHYRSRTQKAAVQSILTMPDGAGLMVSMPTGAGKSLLFQAPVLWWRQADPGACVIVIVPTIALAEDHQRTLQAMPGLEACRALSGSTLADERQDVIARFRNGEIPILLLSPEAAFGAARADLLQSALPTEAAEKYGQKGRLAAVFMDEAHIIESWGRSFRPDFQRLPALVREFRARNPAIRTVLLSATLTPAAREVLRSDYGEGAHWGEIHAETPRYQFDLSASTFPDLASRNAALVRLIDRAPRPAVVYTTRVDQAEALHELLTKARGYKRLALFTGAISNAHERKRIVEAWAENELDLVVATSAFGLGVDKANVRTVIHACLPEGAPRWYQEVGRASRDGHQGLGVTLWVEKSGHGERRRKNKEEDTFQSDEDDAESMAGGGWLSRELAEGRWLALLKGARADTRAESGEPRLILPLDAAREGMDARYTGERNRGWNRSLLNLLQRQGALVLEADTFDDDTLPLHWRAVIRHSGLLAPTDADAWRSTWDAVFAGRNAEVATARRELREFVHFLRRPERDCLLLGAYRLIEPDTFASACGRCPACRVQGRSAPSSLRPRSAPFTWPPLVTAGAELPKGVLLVAPDNGASDHLLHRLTKAGIDQIVTSEGDAGSIARGLEKARARLGFVQSAEDWIQRDGVLPDLPTAFLPTPHDFLPAWLRELQRLAAERPHQTFILVADPGQRVEGRSLQQIASLHAPYDENALEYFQQQGPRGLT